MKYLSFVLIGILFGFTPVHIGEVAEYRYYLEGNKIKFMFMIDVDELEVLKNDQSCDYNEMLALCTSNYITTNSSLFINDRIIEFDLESSSIKNKHLYIHFQSRKEFNRIESISIQNNCFYAYNPHFKNRMIVDIEAYEASYLLGIETKTLKCLEKGN